MKQQPYVLANSLAMTVAIFYIFCRVGVGLFPEVFFNIAQSWFHGIEFSRLDPGSLTVTSFILGFISATFFAWITGYVFARIYKFFLK